MLKTTLALFLGVAHSLNVTEVNWDFDYTKCDDMQDPACIKIAQDVYNYTVPEIRRMTVVMRRITERRIACEIAGRCPTILDAIAGASVPCVNGNAAGYDCNNINLLSFVPLAGSSTPNLNAPDQNGNDIWGWTDLNDPAGGIKRYAITGQESSSTIVDVTDPINPDVLCYIPSKLSTRTSWRDIKIAYSDSGVAYAGIVADRSGQGLQYIDLKKLIAKCRDNRVAPNAYTAIEGTDFDWIGPDLYTGGTNTHNIVGLDEQMRNGNVFSTGNYLYLVGSNSCSGGPLRVDFSSDVPQFAGCYATDGYSHDAECWVYNGPDTRYTGQSICVGYNENSITIMDYTDPDNIIQLSRLTYSTSRYTHQGWRTSDEAYLLMNDELDEAFGAVSSQTTYVVDIRSLTDPSLVPWSSGVNTIDHNLYIKQFCNGDQCNDYAFEANYRAGLRLLRVNPTATDDQDKLTLVGSFKTWAGELSTSFNGMWSNYPYFDDENNPGLVVCQDIETGLFILDVCDAIPECVRPATNATSI